MKKFTKTIVPKHRIFLSTSDDKGVFGPGRGDLLAAVEKLGSLRKAAAALGRSYRQAWGDINSSEINLGFKLVTRSQGGIGGGTMSLTDRGTAFLRAWERHSEQVSKAVASSFKKHISPHLT